MEKKRMIIGAVALVAVSMIFAGVGYAAFTGDYTGTTSSSGTPTVNYVKVELGSGQYTAPLALYYDTENAAGVITYTLKAGCENIYDVTITASPAENTTASFAVTLTGTITGGTLGLQYKIGAGEWTNYTEPVDVTLTSGVGNLQVKVVATPGEGTTTVPTASAVSVSFEATKTAVAA